MALITTNSFTNGCGGNSSGQGELVVTSHSTSALPSCLAANRWWSWDTPDHPEKMVRVRILGRPEQIFSPFALGTHFVLTTAPGHLTGPTLTAAAPTRGWFAPWESFWRTRQQTRPSAACACTAPLTDPPCGALQTPSGQGADASPVSAGRSERPGPRRRKNT